MANALFFSQCSCRIEFAGTFDYRETDLAVCACQHTAKVTCGHLLLERGEMVVPIAAHEYGTEIERQRSECIYTHMYIFSLTLQTTEKGKGTRARLANIYGLIEQCFVKSERGAWMSFSKLFVRLHRTCNQSFGSLAR
jgi:hypothetical protein